MTESAGAAPRPRLLVVDDDATQRTALLRILADGGYTVMLAADATEALRKVLAEPPDLVVLDLRLPDASGVELAGAIRSMAGTTAMPLVVVTAYVGDAGALDPARFGASCVLTKPVTTEQLLTTVQHCLVKSTSSEPTESATNGTNAHSG